MLSNTADTLSLTGRPLDPATVYPLRADVWNLVGYPFDYEQPVVTAFQSIIERVVIVQNSAGDVWIPSQGVNTLQTLVPGEGYMVQVATDLDFVYNDGTSGLALEEDDSPGKFRTTSSTLAQQLRTGRPYTMLVEFDVELADEQPAVIEVYDDNLLVGYSDSVDPEIPTLLTVWQGAVEYGIDGFTPGNQMKIVLRDQFGHEIRSVIREGSVLFGSEAYADLLLAKAPPLPTEFALGEAYPNPFNSTVNLRIELPETREIQFAVFDVLGRLVQSDRISYEAGVHRMIFEATPDMGSGLYFIRVNSGDALITRKVVLLK